MPRDIDIRQNNLCNTSGDPGHEVVSAAFSMVENTIGNGWVSIGWIRRKACGNCLRFYHEFEKNSSSDRFVHFFDTPSLGTTKRFRINWDEDGDYHFHVQICDAGTGGNCTDHSPPELDFNPISAGWGASGGAWAGETHDVSTDMPGINTDTAHFDAIQIRNYPSGSWHTPADLIRCLKNGTAIQPSCNDTYERYHFNFVPIGDSTQGHFKVWTEPV